MDYVTNLGTVFLFLFLVLVLNVAEWISVFGLMQDPELTEEQSQMALYVIPMPRRVFLREEPAW